MDPHINPASGVWDDNYYAKTHGGGGGGRGSIPALQPFPDIKLSDIGGSAVDFANTLTGKENDIFGQYLKVVQAQPKPLDLYSSLETAAGIPQLKQSQSTLQGQIYDLEDTLRRVEPNISARSSNSIVTEAQRQGMVTAAQKPLIENLGWLAQSLGRVSNAITNEKQDIGTKVSLAMEGFKQELAPYEKQLSMVVDQNARLMTGFTADRQATLDILMEKVKRNMQISDMEWQQAQDLAKEERGYIQAVKLKQMEINKPSTQVVEVGGNKVLIDSNTGKTIANLGSSSSGNSSTNLNTNIVPTSNKPTTKPTGTPSASPSYNTNLFNYLFGGGTPATGGNAPLKF